MTGQRSNYGTRYQTCYKALKLKKFSPKKSPAVRFKYFMKEINIHKSYKQETIYYIYTKQISRLKTK